MHCENCKHWKKHSDEESYLGKNRGKCLSPKFIDVSEGDYNLGDDTLEYSDYEAYKAEFTTGSKFGCIHFEEGDK